MVEFVHIQHFCSEDIHDAINWLIKILKVHIVWYCKKESKYGVETCSIDNEQLQLSNEHFYGKSMKKICQNLVTDPFWNLANSQSSQCMEETLLKITLSKIILKGDYQKPFKKLTGFYNHEKQKVTWN